MHQWNISHQQQISRQIHHGILPHAILICGVKGAGKGELSRWLIDVFNCQKPIVVDNIYTPCKQCKTCLLSQSHTNPDTTEVLNKDRTISVEEIRRISHFLETRPQIAQGKSVLLPNAEKLTVSAANALLKTLEEPNDNCIIVLYSDDADSVLPTILSRCQLTNIRPFVGKMLIDALGQTIDDPYVNINHLNEFNDDNSTVNYNAFVELFATCAVNNEVNTEFEELICHHEQGLIWLERCLSNLTRQQNDWNVAKNLSQFQHHWSANTLWHLYQLVIEAKKKLKLLMQANPTFVKEQLLVDIQACIATPEVLN